MNHFAAKCLSSKKSLINNLQVNESEASDEDIIDMVSLHEEAGDIMHVTQSKDTGKILATMKSGRKPVKMLVDSGASCNVVPAKYVPAKTTIIPTNNTLVMYSKSSMPAIGTTQLNIQNPKNSKRHLVKFVVVNGDYTPLLGLQTAQEMELLTIQHDNILNFVAESNQPNNSTPSPCPSNLEEVMTIFGDIFDGTLGHMRGDVHLEIDENAKPTVMPPRRVPIAIKPKVKQELERLTAREAITPVQEPTDWVSNMITTIKPDGSIRLCIDPHYLNQELKRSHYPLPVIDDILPDLSKVKVFSKADLQEGFLQISLDEASSRLTTLQTPWGRYRWLRMPFGISPAPEIFQMKLHQNLEGLPGISTIADDILITGQGDTVQEAEEDHDRNLAKFLSHCREQNIKLKKEKFKYKCEEVQFMGHCLTNEGLKPDPQKVDAILKMEKPQDVTGVQRLIRLVKYLSKFLSNLSQICEPIRTLTYKDVEWRWSTEQDEAFRKIKEAVTTAPVLQYFDAAKHTGCGGVSSQGIGFVLTQDEHPITYASRALTSTEQRYSQIEKELLALVFGLEHNHYYTYGRRVTLWTDHKPLVSIASKPLVSAPKRLQRLMLRLQHYDVEIKYKPGKEMFVADTLSRAYISDHQQSDVEKEVESIHTVNHLAISQERPAEIQKETLSLQRLKETIIKGWLNNKAKVAEDIQQYFSIRDELSVQDEIVFKGQRCIIPKSLRKTIKQKLHRSHGGIQSCLRRAREVVYWPGMTKELTDYIQQCETCNTYSAEQQRQPLIPHEIPERLWQKVACDIFTLQGKDYLCTVDYYSGFFEVNKLEKKDAKQIIKKLKRHFASHGIPLELVSDNGPPYNSQEFVNFANEYEFELRKSSPTYPQSNGRAENAVKTAKQLLKEAISSGNDFYLSLLDWRNTPTEGLDSSPAQRIFGRRTHTSLPTTSNLLKPKTPNHVREKIIKNKNKQKIYYNHGTKDLPPLKRGDIVRVHPLPTDNQGRWFKAKVERKADIRSYIVRTEGGQEYRRNRKHLRATKETFEDLAIGEDHTQDNPEEAKERGESGTAPQRMESTTQNNLNQPAIPRRPVQTAEPVPLRTSGRQTKLPSHLKDFIIDRS